MTVETLNTIVFMLMLGVNTITDIRRMEVDDRAILFSGLFCVGIRTMSALQDNTMNLLLETAVGAGFGLVIGFLMFLGGMGFGDVMLMTVMGGFLGAGPCITTILLSSSLAALYGLLYLKLLRRKSLKTELPFVPFLAAGTIVVMLLT